MKAIHKNNINKPFNPIVFVIKIFVFFAIIANIAILGWVLRNRKMDKKEPQIKFPSYISVVPESLDFGKVQYGKRAISKLTITNTGKNKIYLSRIMSSGIEFAVQPQFSGIELSKDDSVEIIVAYHPVSAKETIGKLTIESSDVGAKYFEIQCKGFGIMPVISVEPGSFDFGNVTEDKASITKTITVKNKGTAELNVSSISVNSQNFHISGALPTSPLKPGESVKLNLTYQPATIGVNDATLIVMSSDPQKPVIKVPVIAAFKKAEGEWMNKHRAIEQLEMAKRLLNSAYMKIYSIASSETRRRELLKTGTEEFKKAWPLYVEANEELQKIDPSLVDKEFYFEKGRLKRLSNQ